MSDDPEIRELRARLVRLEQDAADQRARQVRLEKLIEVLSDQAGLKSSSTGNPPSPPAPVGSTVAIQPQAPKPQDSKPQAPPAAPPAPAATPPYTPVKLPVAKPATPSAAAKALRALHLLPPAQGSGEVNLVAWWTTRIGMLLAVIGVVFFGVYVSVNTPPWVKLTELVVVSIGIALAGVHFEKRLPKFGAVLLGGGLALVYFAALAAYAVPAVKVTDNLAVATFLQLGAIALIFTVALKRQSSTVATMATLLGFVSIFLSIEVGFDDYAILGTLGLTAFSVVLKRWKGWALPIGVAAVLQYAVYLTLAVAIWDSGLGMRSPFFVFSILGTGFFLVFLSAVLEGPEEDGRMSRSQRWIQSINAPVAVAAGFNVAVIVLPSGSLSWYFFGSALVALAAAFWIWRTAPADSLFTMFAVKVAALTGLGICTEWGSRTRWVVLAIEAFVILAAAQRTRKLVLFLVAVLTWILSLGFFKEDAARLLGQMLTTDGLVTGLFVLAGPMFFILLIRSWPMDTFRLPDQFSGILTLPALVPTYLACGLVFELAWGPVALLITAILLALLSRVMRSVIALPAAAIALFYAHLSLHSFNEAAHGIPWLWIGAGSVGLTTALAGWRCAEVESGKYPAYLNPLLLLGTGLIASALALVETALFQSVPIQVAAGLSGVLAAVAAWTGVGTRRISLVGSGVLALAASVVLSAYHQTWAVIQPQADPWYCAAGSGALLVMAGLTLRGTVRDGMAKLKWFTAASILTGITCVFLTWAAIDRNLEINGATWATVGAATVYLGLGYAHRSPIVMSIGSILLGLVMLTITGSHRWPPAGSEWMALAGAIVAGLALAAFPAITDRRYSWPKAGYRSIWMGAHAACALLFLVLIASRNHAPWADLTSVIWAIGGIAVFFIGLFFRSRPHRISGLIVLAACILRVFLVDINSTLYRIAAFIVLGAVLLWVGFSYQRFRHLIEGDEDRDVGPEDGTKPNPDIKDSQG
ncbi:MAG: DUF2339 domain-containing protein [Opitutaceae bacterium]